MNSTLIFVDAGFLSELSKYFGGGRHLKFDYLQFFRHLAKLKGLNLKKIFYYTAPPYQSENPNKEEISRKKGYDSFISHLKEDSLFEVREGRVQKISGSKEEFTQKGVDTLMTLDLSLSKDKFPEVKHLILVTSDTDFVPVIRELRNFDIKIILCTYSDRKRNSKFYLSRHLTECCDEVEYLKKEDMDKFSLEVQNE